MILVQNFVLLTTMLTGLKNGSHLKFSSCWFFFKPAPGNVCTKLDSYIFMWKVFGEIFNYLLQYLLRICFWNNRMVILFRIKVRKHLCSSWRLCFAFNFFPGSCCVIQKVIITKHWGLWYELNRKWNQMKTGNKMQTLALHKRYAAVF